MPGAWRGSTRRQRLPPDWPQRRAQRFALDGHRCTNTLPDGTRCPGPAQECDHHIAGDDHNIANLRSLCTPCHRAKSSAEGNAAKAPRKRTPEPHPGATPPGGCPLGPPRS